MKFPIKVRFDTEKTGEWNYTCLTNNKVYEAVDIIDWPDGTKRYELTGDDFDEQEFYPVEIFEVVS